MRSSSGKLNLPPGTGRAGESAARAYLTGELGYEIVATNYRTRDGEIDIVARDNAGDNQCLVFIEVKTRTNRAFGAGSEQVSAKKSLRLQAAAQSYLAENDLENSDWRIDLISVEMDRSGRVSRIEHIESAIEE
ncbi:MAG: YraN family protein [Chloroflexi bacterium]|nr:YraN family protein [Chloroflexota bacterium]MCH8115906.1 YraN family protein [Chloroflexota bacterium]